jgi:hypothetical protein
MRLRRWIIAGLVLASGAAAWGQVISQRSKVAGVGFTARTSVGRVIRLGQWFPIRVELVVEGTDIFEGALQFRTLDLDGDRVLYTQQVNVSPKPDGRPTTVEMFAIVNDQDECPSVISVQNSRGETVTTLDLPRADVLSDNDLLMIDISETPVRSTGLLATPGWTPSLGMATTLGPYYQNIVTATMPVEQLPTDWIGLDAVDVILWDRPSLANVSLWQLENLATWVRHGGQLVLGLSDQYAGIREDPVMAELLPLTGPGEVVATSDLYTFRRQVALGERREVPPFDTPVQMTLADLAPGAIATLPVTVEGAQSGRLLYPLVAMKPHGSGRVSALTAGMNGLLSQRGVSPEKFFGLFLDLNAYTPEFQEDHANSWGSLTTGNRELYPDLMGPISFRLAQTVRGFIALLFVGAYIVLATLVSWWWLKARRRTPMSWPVFAGIAAAASFLSLTTVAGLRGLSRGVQTVSLVDLEVGQNVARAQTFFGYRSPIRQTVALGLAGDTSFLQPLSRGPQAANFYVTPSSYVVEPTRAELDGVLMRATLKQLHGYWEGDVGGAVMCNILIDAGDGRVDTRVSKITNHLPHDLDGGYLLFADPRQLAYGPNLRVAGLDRPPPVNLDDSVRQKMEDDLKRVPPAYNVLVVGVSGIKAGETTSDLRQEEDVDKLAREREIWERSKAPKRKRMPDVRNLWEEQLAWRGSLATRALQRGLGEDVEAALLSSTRRFILHSTSQFDDATNRVSADGLPELDVTHWLINGRDGQGNNAGYGVLLCWGRAPGPASLQINGDPEPAYRGLTFYRVRVPLRFTGTTPRLPN